MNTTCDPVPSKFALGGLAAVLLLAVSVRGIFLIGADLYEDEAYYWVWSRHLATGYFDHPPLIAWLIRGFSVRGAAFVSSVVFLFAVFGFARDLRRSTRAGLLAAAWAAALPGFILAGSFATPDAPLLALWTLSLWALHHRAWTLTGLLLGAGMLAKYPAVLGLGVALMYALHTGQWRHLWRTGVAAAIVFAPVVFWNVRHDWVSFRFQLGHGLGARAAGWPSVGNFLASQVGMSALVPWLFGLGFCVRRSRRSGEPLDAPEALLAWAAVIPLLVFGLASFRSHSEPNWATVAYVPILIAAAGWRPRVAWAGAILAVAMSAVIASQFLWAWFPVSRDILAERLKGSGILRRLPLEARCGAGATPPVALFAPTYQDASRGAYEAELPATTVGSWRRSQFELWPEPPIERGQNAVWLAQSKATPPEEMMGRFARVEGPHALGARYVFWRLCSLR